MEEKIFSIDGVVDRHLAVQDTLQFHKFEVFTRPCGPYITTWVREFYATYSDLVPQMKKKYSAFRPIQFVMVRGRKVRCTAMISMLYF